MKPNILNSEINLKTSGLHVHIDSVLSFIDTIMTTYIFNGQIVENLGFMTNIPYVKYIISLTLMEFRVKLYVTLHAMCGWLNSDIFYVIDWKRPWNSSLMLLR